jgi:threonyl-tRNA synthetase
MVLPKRLGANYIDKDGSKAVPVMLHHAVLGSLGRFIGILLEQSGGELPFWLSPDQVAVIPIGQDQQSAAARFRDELFASDVRPVLLDQSETFSRRLVMARDMKIPVVVIIGAKEHGAGMVSIKEGSQQRTVSIEEGLADLSSRRGPV